MLKYLISLLVIIGLTNAYQPAVAQQKNVPIRLPCGAGLVDHQHGPGPTVHSQWAKNNFIHRVTSNNESIQIGQLSLTFVGHSTFLIRSPQNIKIITDYNNYFRAGVLPDIVTMNVQRGNHSTDFVAPNISHVLRGWTEGRRIKLHDVILKDVRVYNLPTNITDFGVGFTNFSSIFIIQSQGLCIAHMGHLRHILDQQQLSTIGRIDVLLIPIDRQITQSFKELLHNIKGINPRLLVPMHFNFMLAAEAFLTDIKKLYPIRRSSSHTVVLSHATLPTETNVLLLSPQRTGSKLGSQL